MRFAVNHGSGDRKIKRYIKYFRFNSQLGIKPWELDQMDNDMVEAFDIILKKVSEPANKNGNSVEEEIAKMISDHGTIKK